MQKRRFLKVRDGTRPGDGRGWWWGGGGDGEIQDPGKREMMGGKNHREDEVRYKIWGRERMGGGT